MPVASVPLYSYAPAQDVGPVTPSDSVSLSPPARRLYCSAPGNVSILTPRGGTAVFAVVAGQFLDVNVARVNATGTTATVLALY